MKRLDDVFPSVIYDEERHVIYYLIFNSSWRYMTLQCQGDSIKPDDFHAPCGNDPIFALMRFDCDRIVREGDMIAMRFRAPNYAEYCKTDGFGLIEPGERYIARTRIGHLPLWPARDLRKSP